MMKKSVFARTCWVVFGVALLGAGVWLPTVVGADEANYEEELAILERTGKAFAAVAGKAIPAVVSIEVEKSGPVARHQRGFGQGRSYDQGEELLRQFFGYPRERAPQAYRQQGTFTRVTEELP